MISTDGSLATLASFANTNGASPYGGLTFGPDGDLYGTTYKGGGLSGTVFRITTNGTLTTLAYFDAFNLTNRGFYPTAGVIFGPDGNLYGTTTRGGAGNVGTVFTVRTDGTFATLYSFSATNGNGARPEAGLTLGPDGNLYGTTTNGGSSGGGTVFMITTNGSLTTLASFAGTNGASPQAALTLGADGIFYGTTLRGGSNGYGTVFEITTNGTLTMLASFDSTNKVSPQSGLTFGPDGKLYGTAIHVGFGGPSASDGTVFMVTTNGSLTTLVRFNGTNGANPTAGLTLGPDGNFYGTTYNGGNGGVIYRLNLPPSITTQPSNQIAAIGSNATFTVSLFGTAPFAYQWLSNSTPIPDATNSTVIIQNVTPSSVGDYQAIITNAWGSITSSIATLSLPVSPMITNQPTDETVPIGGAASFVVGAGGSPPLAYQWYFSTSTLLAAGTNAALSFSPVLASQAGQYQVIVTSPYGSATSSAATLAVLLQPNCYGISNSGSETMTLLLASTPGSTNRLWVTTNLSLPLAQWQPISTNAADPTGFFQFTDTNTGDSPAKFYILSSP